MASGCCQSAFAHSGEGDAVIEIFMLQTLLQTDVIVAVFLFVFGSVLISNILAVLLNIVVKIFMIVRKID